MRFSDGTSPDFAEIELVEVCPNSGDLQLSVVAQVAGFAGRSRPWVERECWVRFVEELSGFSVTRSGAPVIASMSPGEFEARFRSFDDWGHTLVELQIEQLAYHPPRKLHLAVALQCEPDQVASAALEFAEYGKDSA